MAFDIPRARIVLFGGDSKTFSQLDDTWEWDGASWTAPALTTKPVARAGAGMAHDLARGRIVLFGGRTIADPFADTWEYTGAGGLDAGRGRRAVGTQPDRVRI
jgi:hypothetical protein